MEFLVHGAVRYGERGVCMDFEETKEKLTANVASLGFDLRALARRKKLMVDFVSVERNQIAESGEYNLEGLFIRLAHAVKAIKAKRVVLEAWPVRRQFHSDWSMRQLLTAIRVDVSSFVKPLTVASSPSCRPTICRNWLRSLSKRQSVSPATIRFAPCARASRKSEDTRKAGRYRAGAARTKTGTQGHGS
jgi:KaiC